LGTYHSLSDRLQSIVHGILPFDGTCYR
jgi:hypothetical protein